MFTRINDNENLNIREAALLGDFIHAVGRTLGITKDGVAKKQLTDFITNTMSNGAGTNMDVLLKEIASKASGTVPQYKAILDNLRKIVPKDALNDPTGSQVGKSLAKSLNPELGTIANFLKNRAFKGHIPGLDDVSINVGPAARDAVTGEFKHADPSIGLLGMKNLTTPKQVSLRDILNSPDSFVLDATHATTYNNLINSQADKAAQSIGKIYGVQTKVNLIKTLLLGGLGAAVAHPFAQTMKGDKGYDASTDNAIKGLMGTAPGTAPGGTNTGAPGVNPSTNTDPNSAFNDATGNSSTPPWLQAPTPAPAANPAPTAQGYGGYGQGLGTLGINPVLSPQEARNMGIRPSQEFNKEVDSYFQKRNNSTESFVKEAALTETQQLALLSDLPTDIGQLMTVEQLFAFIEEEASKPNPDKGYIAHVLSDQAQLGEQLDNKFKPLYEGKEQQPQEQTQEQPQGESQNAI